VSIYFACFTLRLSEMVFFGENFNNWEGKCRWSKKIIWAKLF
jgi:hypothetical protein